MNRVRTNVWKLPAGDQTLSWYARAVEAMQKKPINEPTSWRYQAAIHEYDDTSDPLADPADVLPSTADQRKFWTQCQHGSWFFLAWHRMYLHHFEKIVAAEIVKLGGPADWALPYWEYSKDAASALLPPAFRKSAAPTSLYVKERATACNLGKRFLQPADVSLQCLKQPTFSGPAQGASFGGPVTVFHHDPGTTGAVEATPHGNIHNEVGGGSGWMGAFNTAALDPIFWLHHANIDRLWEVWVKRPSSHGNPTDPKWLSKVKFSFHDFSGAVVTMTCQDVLDTKSAPLSYEYDDVTDPLSAPGPVPVAPTGARSTVRMTQKRKPPELIGASKPNLKLGKAVTHAVVDFSPKASRARARAMSAPGTAASSGRVYLNIENLTGKTRVPAYDVYINLPKGADPSNHQDLHAGRLPMFGLVEASRSDVKHSGAGLGYVLDVTDLVQRLSSKNAWDPDRARVSFAPAREGADAPIRVGRVSFYVE